MFARRADVVEREAAGSAPLAVPGDLTGAADLDRLVTTATVAAFGGIDIVVLNGGGPPPGAAAEVTRESVTAAVELLLLPHVSLVGLCLPHLRASGRGRIIAIESTSVKEPIANLALSNAVRPGVVGWLKTLSRELGPDWDHRQHDRPRPDRHRAAAGAVRRRRPTGRGAGADPGAPRRHPGRDRGDRVLLRLGTGRVRQRRGRAGRRRHAERALLECRANGRRVLLWSVAAVAAALVGLAWVYPSHDYLYLPNTASPVAAKVKVEGEKPTEDTKGAIYYVDVTVRQATLGRAAPAVRPSRRCDPRAT